MEKYSRKIRKNSSEKSKKNSRKIGNILGEIEKNSRKIRKKFS